MNSAGETAPRWPLALAALLAAVGTDGIDGHSPAAGAIVDGTSVARMKVDAQTSLERNDSYGALASSGDVLVTGPTGTNVMDVAVALRG